jgi:tRNA(adenine34) deaminase
MTHMTSATYPRHLANLHADAAGDSAGEPGAVDSEGLATPEADATREDLHWMKIALEEADLASRSGEVPIGCVMVDRHGREMGRGRNARESFADPTAHAEMIAIREAAARLLGWRLEQVTAYVTLEPCAMCAGAFVQARVARVVYACADPKGGAIDTMFGIGRDDRLNHRFQVTAGVLRAESATRLQRFFSELRR